MDVTFSAEAESFLRDKGGRVAVDYIPPIG